MKIIGITWPSASWKGTLVDFLVKECGYVHYSVSDYLTEQIQKSWLPINRDTMREVANQLRTEHWPSFIVEELYTQAEKAGKDAIIESLRALGEVEKLKEKSDFLLLSIDADQRLRFERAIKRGSAKDTITWEQFQEQEILESNNSDPTKQNISACQGLADLHIDNNGSILEFYQQIKEKLHFSW